MRIVKPQQLVYLKNSYQLNKDSYLGISAICGFYLNKTNHFITEPEIWEVWDKSPKSISFLDIPVVKQFAEYVLLGHASIGKEVLSLDVEVKVGKLKKEWQVVGEGNYLKRQRFYAMSMDHCNVWGGREEVRNPLGKGYTINDNMANVILRKGDRLFEREPLASPSPIPFGFYERQQYIDKISPIMASPQYMENTYPGYPKELDLRYFQMAAPDQRLDSHVWPANTKFSLSGFGQSEEIIQGVLPNVQARAFGFNNNKLTEELTLLLQTIWFLPDFNVAFMVFTGETPIQELTEDHFDTLLLALDNAKTPRNQKYYDSIYKKRVIEKNELAALLDLELMPEGYQVNVINSRDKHPSSLNYQFGPMNDAETTDYFEKIKKAIRNVEKPKKKPLDKHQQAIEKQKLLLSQIKFEDTFSYSDESLFEDKNYKSFYSWNTELKGKHFKHCKFKDIDFVHYQLIDCVFEQCYFYNCNFRDNRFQNTLYDKSHFFQCKLIGLTFQDSVLNEINFLDSQIQGWSGQQLKFKNSQIEQGEMIELNFSQVELDSIVFTKSKLRDLTFKESFITNSLFEETDLEQTKFIESNLEKTSFMYGQCSQCTFENVFILSFSIGLECKLSQLYFQDSWLEKIGMGKTSVLDSTFEYCNIKEMNGSNSDFSNTSFTHCDLMVAIFKDAQLTATKWQECSLQQNIFYNANFENAQLEECNLAGANLALITTNEDTKFKRCLVDQVLWLPKKV